MPVWNSEFATSRESDRAKLEYADVIINIGEVFERREKFSNRYLFRYVSSIEYRLPGLFVKTSINRRKSRKRFMLLWNLRHSRGSIAKKTSLFTKNYRTMCRRVKFREREKANPIVSLLHCFFSNERNYTTIYMSRSWNQNFPHPIQSNPIFLFQGVSFHSFIWLQCLTFVGIRKGWPSSPPSEKLADSLSLTKIVRIGIRGQPRVSRLWFKVERNFEQQKSGSDE